MATDLAAIYRIAVVGTDGEFEIIDTFAAACSDSANAYAARYYGDLEWFVLDADGRNINGGIDG